MRYALLLLACLPLLAGRPAAAEPNITVNGAPLACPRPPLNRSGVVLLPLRPVLEALGAQSDWRSREGKLQVRRAGQLVELWIGTPVAQVNGLPVQLDVPPLLIDGLTYVPLRVIAQAFAAVVRWDPRTKTIAVNAPAPIPARTE